MDRNKMIQIIHVLYPQAGMDKTNLYDIVERETGKRSISACSDKQLESIIGLIRCIGHLEEARSGRLTLKQRRYIEDLEWKLGWSSNPERLRKFLLKYYKVQHVDWLTVRQASDLIESLKSLLKQQKERETV